MSIRFIKERGRFLLNTKKTTYAFEIMNGRYLRHLYYGRKTDKIEASEPQVISFSPYIHGFGASSSPDVVPNEISFYGSGDFRATALRIRGEDGTGVTDFVYDSYRIFNGRRNIEGLTFARADERTRTLEITMVDSVSGCKLLLYYTVFENYDIISRYMVIENNGKAPVKIEKCMSLELVLERDDLDMITFYGRHNYECKFQRVPVHHGIQSICSRRGGSSHQYNPFMALCSKNANEERGDVYGFNFVYSGSYLNEVELDQINTTKVLMGLGSECFGYTVEPDGCAFAPSRCTQYLGGVSLQY